MTAQLPPLLVGSRRWLFAVLVTIGLVNATLAIVSALGVGELLSGTSAPGGPTVPLHLVLLVVGAVLGMAVANYLTRVLGEQLGQDYVSELRRGLMSATISGRSSTPIGIVLARATNDLSGVRIWIAQGIVPLVAAGPLIAAAALYFMSIDGRIGVIVFGMLALLGAASLVLSSVVFDRARTLRRHRGRLAALVADTVRAAEGVRMGGGVDREVARIDRAGGAVAESAVRRASAAGAVRALVLAVASLIAVVAVVIGAAVSLDFSLIASAVTLAGILSAPLADVGRCLEYRQNYRAAARILGPALANATVTAPLSSADVPPNGAGTVSVRAADTAPVRLVAGDRLVIDALGDPEGEAIVTALKNTAAGIASGVSIDQVAIAALAPSVRRRHIGIASAGVALERGPVVRAVRYRHPDASAKRAAEWVRQVGLQPAIAQLPDGIDTRLREGGAPLTTSHRALVQLARAIAGTPAVVVLDRLDDDLDADALDTFTRVVADYPGVVVLRTRRPATVAPGLPLRKE